MILFDTHAHLDGEEYATDREEMIAGRSAGVVTLSTWALIWNHPAGRSGWRKNMT